MELYIHLCKIRKPIFLLHAFILLICFFAVVGCGEQITSIEADGFIVNHIKKLQDKNYKEAYMDYTLESRNKQPFVDFKNLNDVIAKELGNIKSYIKIKDPKFIFKVDYGRIFDVIYDVEYERGTLRAVYTIDKQNGILSIYSCNMKRLDNRKGVRP